MDTLVVFLIGAGFLATLLFPAIRQNKGNREGVLIGAVLFLFIAGYMYFGADATNADTDIRRGY